MLDKDLSWKSANRKLADFQAQDFGRMVDRPECMVRRFAASEM